MSLINRLCPEVRLPEHGASAHLEPGTAYRELIELELSRGRNAMGIWQDLVDKHEYTSSYQSVQRFVLKLRGAVSLKRA